MEETERIRRQWQIAINIRHASREELEAEFGKVWDTDELAAEFEVISFMAPMVVVRRKIDGRKGSLLFQHAPRYYFDFLPG